MLLDQNRIVAYFQFDLCLCQNIERYYRHYKSLLSNDLVISGRSFMNSKNRVGPRMDH